MEENWLLGQKLMEQESENVCTFEFHVKNFVFNYDTREKMKLFPFFTDAITFHINLSATPPLI